MLVERVKTSKMSATVKPEDGVGGKGADPEKGGNTPNKQKSWQEAAMEQGNDEEAITLETDTSIFAFLHQCQEKPWAKTTNNFLSRNMGWSVVVMILTVWALFMDDLLYLAFPKEADMVFFVISWLIFIIFFMEVVLSSIVERGYILSLPMAMDLLAAMSLIPFTQIVEQGIDSTTDETMDEAAVARIARTFRALRILRATRAAAMTLKTTTVMKRATAEANRKSNSSDDRRKSLGKMQSLQEKLAQLNESKGTKSRSASIASSTGMESLRQELKREKKKMKEEEGGQHSVLEETLLVRTNATMLLGILVLLMGTTLMQADEVDMTIRSGLSLLDTSAMSLYKAGVTLDDANLSPLTNTYINLVEKKSDSTLELPTGRLVMHLYVQDIEFVNKDITKYRSSEVQNVTISQEPMTHAAICIKGLRDQDNMWSIAVTIFSVFVIVAWAESFRYDHRRFVIQPVKRMIKHLKHMAEDPRLAIGALALVTGRAKKNVKASGEMETIESCVARFGMLLKVGFGEAGMGIIASNMGSGGNFNPVVEGVKVFAIFGFCDIRNFTDCCEVLEEETMIFTNQIAIIVHQHVHKSGGSVNKNIGDAFLTVWKLKIPDGDQAMFDNGSDATVEKVHTEANSAVADAAMNAFVRTRYLLETDERIQILGQDARLQKKLPGYTVRMGYGLHFGWAIEGAVGSKYKVDATYLSPHVNMSARLESSSKQFGVQMLFSGPFYDALGEESQSQCRPMDCVTVKGSNVPVMLYTHHISEFKVRGLSKEQTKEFDAKWLEAFNLYKGGADGSSTDWPKSQELMRRCLAIAPDDPPSLLLLRVMGDGPAPAEWGGYRPLTEK